MSRRDPTQTEQDPYYLPLSDELVDMIGAQPDFLEVVSCHLEKS